MEIYIAQGLLKTWKEMEEYRKNNNPSQPKTPLMYYLEFNYKERYVALCRRLNVEPVSFGKWLRKRIVDVV